MAKETKGAAVYGVRTPLRDNIDHRAARAAELRGVIASVDLEFLDRFLADRRPHAAPGVVHFPAIHTD